MIDTHIQAHRLLGNLVLKLIPPCKRCNRPSTRVAIWHDAGLFPHTESHREDICDKCKPSSDNPARSVHFEDHHWASELRKLQEFART